MIGYSMRVAAKALLTKVGPLISKESIHTLDASLNYLEAGRWMAAKGFNPARRLASRQELFRIVAEPIANKRVLYLEFGVFKGEATRYWSELLKNPESLLHGFDSFEGLPEV